MERQLSPDSLISVVVPIYNEAENIESFIQETRQALLALPAPGGFELVICDDGSTDGSGDRLDRVAENHPDEVRVIHLARNFGHGAALSAGLEYARGRVVIVMDGDMQDDSAAFVEFLTKWSAGYDVVYAIRTAREENALARLLFWFFYRLLNWMANIDLPLDAGNFCLMDRTVVDFLRAMPERNLYLPGLRAWVGFRQIGVPVPRRARYDNRTRVGLRGLMALAMNAVFSFSIVPLFAFRILGLAAIALSFVFIVIGAIVKLRSGTYLSLPSNLISIISFFTGINLIGTTVLGEYIVRIYDEVKGRPRYIISRTTDAGEASGSSRRPPD